MYLSCFLRSEDRGGVNAAPCPTRGGVDIDGDIPSFGGGPCPWY